MTGAIANSNVVR